MSEALKPGNLIHGWKEHENEMICFVSLMTNMKIIGIRGQLHDKKNIGPGTMHIKMAH